MTGNERIPFESQFKTTEIFKRESAIRENNILAFSKTMNGYFNIVTNDAWQLWNKAKAQAVPDQIINEIQAWIAKESFMSYEAFDGLFVVDANELAEFIEQLVKSESGAEG
ncbi:hypothetical protein [Acinetobacter baumannii]|uniref:Uncharacterized protein n=1 Tax=Acinetobacter baumannii TaxID=470 RepID=A0AA44XN14_ACIBA|nr:hypothetical protein [Acinetobacter baumannii]EKA72286.1 hypothetical protein ACINWC692_1053 [Acinetobacter baumannii WC-692]PQL81375.1 hypothetical protein CV954_014245 [Acinetobacter baumannii]HAV3170231.1 hypothetical protein [Acinetobacter baumannii]